MTDAQAGDPFEIGESTHGATAVITVRGELDLDTVPELATLAYPTASTAAGGLVVDLTDVTFLSSSSITVLVRASEHLPPAARMALVAVQGVVVRPVQLSGIDRVMATFTNLADAIAHVQPSGPKP